MKTGGKSIIKKGVRITQFPLPQGRWNLEANGFLGSLNLTVGGNGLVTGTAFTNPIRGWYDQPSGKLTFVRLVNGFNNQVYEGYLFRRTVSGGRTRYIGRFLHQRRTRHHRRTHQIRLGRNKNGVTGFLAYQKNEPYPFGVWQFLFFSRIF